MCCGQEAIAKGPDSGEGRGGVARPKDHITWEILGFTPEPIAQPCSRARVADHRKTGMEKETALCVLVKLRRHGPDDAKVVCAFSDPWEKIAHLQAALPSCLEVPIRGGDPAIVV